MSFVHLHVHTEYSLLDGCNRIKPMIAKAKELGMPAVAITDHGVMSGAISFYNECKAQGVKPLIGCEVYVAQRGRLDKDAHKDSRPYHLTLIAKDREGYSNLTQLVSAAFLEGYYYKPRVDHELLKKHGKGLVCLSGCLRGEVNDALLNDDYQLAKERLTFLKEVFGDDLFVELMNHGLPEQHKTNPLLVKLAKELDLLTVATNDSHYLNREDASIQDILICVATGKKLADTNRMKMSTDQFYFKSREEMLEAFAFCPEAVDNTLKVAEKCDLEIDFSTVYLPKFPVPEGQTAEGFLKDLCQKGLITRFGTLNPGEKYLKRLEYELGIIIGKGFPDYFLLVWDFINWSREHGIPVGPGRGSAAGSLVAYLVGITQLDPLPHDLLFERFLNPERTELPDIDTDFCVVRRGEVIQYCRDKYGFDRVSQIATYGRMKAKQAIRDVGRVMDVPLPEVDKLAKAIPPGLNVTLSQALESPSFLDLYENNPTYKELVDQALRCEGICRNTGIHAAGVIISSRPLGELVPLQKGPQNEVVVQYDMSDSASVGMVKMDFLGLRNLTVIDDCLKIIEYSRHIKLNMAELKYDDQATYELLGNADTNGVFQLESDGMKRYLRMLKPDRFSDIVAFLALYRPGPISGGVVDDFIKRRHGKGGGAQYPHPKLEPILSDTYGFFLYQEQVMLTASILAGFTMAEADKLRKAMGKKKMEVMEKYRHKFVDGAIERGVDGKIAEDIFETMANFAKYGFNKSHSAAYALVSYQTAWLKTYYRPEYMAALMTSVMNSIDKVSFFIRECRAADIQVLPPDVNESMAGFTVVGSSIRWGLAAVRNVGVGAVENMVKLREKDGKFKDLADFFKRVDLRQVNRKVVEACIKSGAMNCFKETKATLLSSIDRSLEQGQRLQKEAQSGQFGLFDNVAEEQVTCEDFIEKRLPELETRVLLDFEKEMLGIYLSGSPLDEFRKELKTNTNATLEDLPSLPSGGDVTVGGLVTDCRIRPTRNNRGQLAFMTIDDDTGHTDIVVRPQIYDKFSELCEKGKIILVSGAHEVKQAFNAQSSADMGEEGEEVGEPDDTEQILEHQIIANTITDLESLLHKNNSPKNTAMEDCSGGLNIFINQYQGDALSQMREVLLRYHGKQSVYLHIKSPDKTTILQLDPTFYVSSAPELTNELELLLGKGCIKKDSSKVK